MSYLLPAMLLIGIGGPGCQACLFHTANLFHARGTALNSITASIGVSFSIFEVLTRLTTSFDIPLQSAFLMYCSLPFACTAFSAFTMSDVPFSPASSQEAFASNLTAFDAHMACAEVIESAPSQAPARRQQVRTISLGAARPIAFIQRKKTVPQELRSHQIPGALQTPLLRKRSSSVQLRFPSRLQQDIEENDELIGAPFLKQLRSGAFAELTLIFAISALFYNSFLGNMQDEAKATLSASSTLYPHLSWSAASCVSTYLRVSPLSGLLNPLLGYCIDQHGFQPMLIVTLLSGALHPLALRCGAFFVGAALFSLFQGCFFSYLYSYLAFKFGFEYYGLLAGIIQSVASVATFALQPALRDIAGLHGWPCVQLIQLTAFGLLSVLLVSLRLHWALVSRRRRREGGHLSMHCFDSPPLSVHASPGVLSTRSYSDGDLHNSPFDNAHRRRSDLFPHTDDILICDGALPQYSRAAYLLKPHSAEELAALPEATKPMDA